MFLADGLSPRSGILTSGEERQSCVSEEDALDCWEENPVMSEAVSEQNTLVRKLQRNLPLSKGEVAAVKALPWRVENLPRGKQIVFAGEKPTRSFTVLDGFVTSSKTTRQGISGVTGIHIPGDMPDLFGLYLEVMDIDMQAASPCTVAFVDHLAVKALCAAYPKLNGALWRLTLVDAAILREWIINMGHRPSTARLAHFFCEIMLRMREVGRAKNDRCHFPFTQAALADLTGMSTVHLNRSLQELRGAKLVSFDGRELGVPDLAGLQKKADFQMDYLHLLSTKTLE